MYVSAVPPWLARRNVSAVPVDRSGVISVSWSAPVVPTGELPITGYSIQYHIRGSGVSGYQYMNATQSPADVTDLLPGTEYQVYVAAVNVIGLRGYCCVRTLLIVRTHNGKFDTLTDLSEFQYFAIILSLQMVALVHL